MHSNSLEHRMETVAIISYINIWHKLGKHTTVKHDDEITFLEKFLEKYRHK
jgi:hypothetical protein